MKLKNKCKTDVSVIFMKSLQVAFCAVIGYTLFIDLRIMTSTKNYFVGINEYVPYLNIVSAISMILCIALFKVMELFIITENQECIKY